MNYEETKSMLASKLIKCKQDGKATMMLKPEEFSAACKHMLIDSHDGYRVKWEWLDMIEPYTLWASQNRVEAEMLRPEVEGCQHKNIKASFDGSECADCGKPVYTYSTIWDDRTSGDILSDLQAAVEKVKNMPPPNFEPYPFWAGVDSEGKLTYVSTPNGKENPMFKRGFGSNFYFDEVEEIESTKQTTKESTMQDDKADPHVLAQLVDGCPGEWYIFGTNNYQMTIAEQGIGATYEARVWDSGDNVWRGEVILQHGQQCYGLPGADVKVGPDIWRAAKAIKPHVDILREAVEKMEAVTHE